MRSTQQRLTPRRDPRTPHVPAAATASAMCHPDGGPGTAAASTAGTAPRRLPASCGLAASHSHVDQAGLPAQLGHHSHPHVLAAAKGLPARPGARPPAQQAAPPLFAPLFPPPPPLREPARTFEPGGPEGQACRLMGQPAQLVPYDRFHCVRARACISHIGAWQGLGQSGTSLRKAHHPLTGGGCAQQHACAAPPGQPWQAWEHSLTAAFSQNRPSACQSPASGAAGT